jgi:hypothetical protein
MQNNKMAVTRNFFLAFSMMAITNESLLLGM